MPIRIFMLAAFAILAGVTWGLSSIPNYHCEKNEYQAHEENREHSERPPKPAHPKVVAVYCWIGKRTSDQWTAFSSVLLALITAFLAWFAFRQAETTRAELRAYVMIDTARIDNLAMGGMPEAQLTVKNSGATPAHNVTHWSRMGFAEFPLVTQLPGRQQDILPLSVLAPGGTFHIATGIDRALNLATIQAIRARSHALYVVGEIRYVDAFGVRRETAFCLFCTGQWADTGQVANYEVGNRIT